MRKIWISIISGLFTVSITAQDIQQTLYEAGFENVLVHDRDSVKAIFFEHREFRNPFHSMQYADLLLEGIKEDIFWVPLYHNIPIGKYSSRDLKFSGLSELHRSFFREHNDLYKGYRFHFRIQPDLSARFGYYENPFQVKFNLNLDTRVYLTRGLSIQTGVSIPVSNKLDDQDMQPRLAPSMLHYFTQPKNHHFLALSLGSFYFDRYGFDLQYRYADLENPWSFGFEAGLTGFYWLSAGGFYAEPLDNLSAVADVEYRLPFEKLSLKMSAGQFLFQDKGVRADVIRQFGSVDIGLHVAATDAGTTGGFQFAFSLFPGKILRTRKIELRTTEEFRWEYTYNNEDPVARSYRIGMPRLGDLLRQYHEGMGD